MPSPGDGVESPQDQDEDPLDFDQDWANWLLGQYALVGFTTRDAHGEAVLSREQLHGRIVEVTRGEVKIACEGNGQGREVSLPPDQRAFNPARPGRYMLETTGEVVDDPDIITNWTIVDAPPS